MPVIQQLSALRDGCAGWIAGQDRAIIWAAVLGLVILIVALQALHTRSSSAKGDGPTLPPSYPSWIPILGHVPHMAVDREGFLSRLRNLYPDGLYSIWLLRKPHVVVYSPSFTSTILNKPSSVVDSEFLRPTLMTSTFGLSRRDAEHYGSLTDEVVPQLSTLLTDEGLSSLTTSTIRQIKLHLVDLLTFNPSPADQSDWEVRAGASVVESPRGESYVELDLFELVRNFVAKTANQGLFGTDFVQNFPDAWDHIWRFDEGFVHMTFVPLWLPLPRVTRARAAAHKLRQYLQEFNEALDKHLDGEDAGARWQDLDDVSPLVKSRARLLRDSNLSPAARAGTELALAWAMNANSNPLISWMVWEIARDPIILERIREETAPYVEVVQPKNEFGPAVWIPPEVRKIDLDGLLTKCPLLKAAYVETLRVYTAVWNVKYTKEDVVLGERGKANESFLLEKGRYVHMPQHVHQSDPEYFPEPKEWHPERHLHESVDASGKTTYTADLGTMKPYSKHETHGVDARY
ncbi:hypothetical protein K4F52_002003 [Lecanicillium sp. MT-2017a]|nr:hypothetical protein K4F52_002003 [Lecanicillium sp. MT-2017a]